MDSLDADVVTEAGGKVFATATSGVYVEIAILSSTYGWDQATEAKVRQLADQMERMPTSDEISKAIDE